ncbi:MAG: hypothetical protein MJZ59_05945 [Paludibacteraceae bacterium]|nr:hypothetical protein [Paludibacteraceae bacterium]
MKTETKSHIIASVGTSLVMVLIFLLLWFILISVPQPEEDEGIMVSFGEEMEMGGGLPSQEPYLPTESSEAASPEVATPEPLITQEDEAAMAVQREQERQRKAEQERQAAERRKQQEAIAKANQLGALFGNTDSPQGANGQAGEQGSAKNGNPLGHGTSGGNDWNLDGRYLIGSLPQPAATFNREGKVVVTIVVDKEGNVVSACAGKGTDIADEATKQLAVKAAYRAKFNMVDHPNAVMGNITYYFKFK